jgi:plasmid stabilization system protein ParE
MAADAPARRLEWSPGALDAYLSTLARIAAEDAVTARQFIERVAQSLQAILSHPFIGTPAARRGERRHAIPGTGHVINYRVTRGAVRIQLWYRARRHTLRR